MIRLPVYDHVREARPRGGFRYDYLRWTSGQTRRVRLMEKVLIANRGEIAVRIAKTLRGMDMKSVGIAHEYEGETPATRCVDELIVLRGDSPRRRS